MRSSPVADSEPPEEDDGILRNEPLSQDSLAMVPATPSRIHEFTPIQLTGLIRDELANARHLATEAQLRPYQRTKLDMLIKVSYLFSLPYSNTYYSGCRKTI